MVLPFMFLVSLLRNRSSAISMALIVLPVNESTKYVSVFEPDAFLISCFYNFHRIFHQAI